MIRRPQIEVEKEVEKDRYRAFLNNPLGLPISCNNDNDGKYHIGKTNILDQDHAISVFQNLLINVGNHKRVLGTGTMEGVFVFLGNVPDTSEVGKKQITNSPYAKNS